MPTVNDGAEPAKSAQGLALDDVGLLSGVVVVDRLRTLGGQLLDLHEHVARFCRSAQLLGIDLPSQQKLRDRVTACVEAEQECYVGDDFCVVLLATPGRISSPIDPDTQSRTPTLIIHTQPIDWRRLAHWYRSGQALQVATARSVPAMCWSPKIKTRARLHYYLADQQAVNSTNDPYAAGLLLDERGCVTETSSANVLLVEGERLVSPQPAGILDGISLGRTVRLAMQLDVEVSWEDISIERALQADGILLCGSTGCLWSALQLNERVFKLPQQQPLLLRLWNAWQRDVACDFLSPADIAAKR